MTFSRVTLVLALVVLLAGLAAADAPTVLYDGLPYVDLARLATDLKAKADAKAGAINAELRAGGHVVRLTRNWAQIIVDGSPVVLDAPVRVKDGRWLVPKKFVRDVVPRSTASATVAPAASPASPIPGAALDEMRVRSYPSFTRVVLETSAPVTHRLDGSERDSVRVRIAGLLASPRSEEVNDGFIESVKIGRVGNDAMVLVTFAGAPGELRASAKVTST